METVYLVTSLFILLAGMAFQSGVTTAGSGSHVALTWAVALVLVTCVCIFMGMLALEVYRSYRFARLVGTVRRASMTPGSQLGHAIGMALREGGVAEVLAPGSGAGRAAPGLPSGANVCQVVSGPAGSTSAWARAPDAAVPAPTSTVGAGDAWTHNPLRSEVTPQTGPAVPTVPRPPPLSPPPPPPPTGSEAGQPLVAVASLESAGAASLARPWGE
jgi:hypothetical protein